MFSDGVIQAFLAGQSLKHERMRMAQEQEDRKLQREVLLHNVKRLKLEDQLTARSLAEKQAAMMQGLQSERDVTPDQIAGPPMAFPPASAVGMEGVPDAQIRDRGEPIRLPSAQLPSVSVPELGINQPGMSVPVLTKEQVDAAAAAVLRRAALSKPVTNAPGSVTRLPATGEVLGRGDPLAPRAPTQASLAERAAGGDALAQAALDRLRKASPDALIPVTETDPVSGDTVTTLVPKRPGVISRVKPGDNPALPRDVVNYIQSLPSKTTAVPKEGHAAGSPWSVPYTFENALSELRAVMPQLQRQHPRLNPIDAEQAVRKVFTPPPGTMNDLLAILNGRSGASAAPQNAVPVPSAPVAPMGAGPASAAPPMPAPSPNATGGQFKVEPQADGQVVVAAPDGSRTRFKSQQAAEAAIVEWFQSQQAGK